MHKKWFGDLKQFEEAVDLTHQLGDMYRAGEIPREVLSSSEVQQLELFSEEPEQNFGEFKISIDPMPEVAANVLRTGFQTKEMVDFIVVQKDGQCLELFSEDDPTPAEAVGIAKFISTVQIMALHGFNIDWSKMIDNLGIRNHFVEGLKDHTLYRNDTPSLHIFLFDPK